MSIKADGLYLRAALAGLLFAASVAASANALPAYPRCGAVPADWIADQDALDDHQTFHQIEVAGDGSLRWNDAPVSIQKLQARLQAVAKNRLSRSNQVGLKLGFGAECGRVAQLRTLMEHTLDCGRGMCRNGGLSEPPPPPARGTSGVTSRQSN